MANRKRTIGHNPLDEIASERGMVAHDEAVRALWRGADVRAVPAAHRAAPAHQQRAARDAVPCWMWCAAGVLALVVLL